MITTYLHLVGFAIRLKWYVCSLRVIVKNTHQNEVYRKYPREQEVETLGGVLVRKGAAMGIQKKLKQWSPLSYHCLTHFPFDLTE